MSHPVHFRSILGKTIGGRAKPLRWSGHTGCNDLNSDKVKQKGTPMTGREGGTVTERSGASGAGTDFTLPSVFFSPSVSPPLFSLAHLPYCTQTLTPVGRRKSQQPQVRTVAENQPISASVCVWPRDCAGLRTFSFKPEGVWGHRISYRHPQPLPNILTHQVSEEPGPI